MAQDIIGKIKNYETRLARTAKNLVNDADKHKIILKVIPGGGSYTRRHSEDDKKILIVIDPNMAYCEGDDLASLLLKVEGIVAHEASHVCFSDFNVVRENKTKELAYQQAITEVAKELKKDFNDKNLQKALYEAIYEYVYYKNLADMFNSVEDAAIEYWITRKNKATYGSVVAMRDFIYSREQNYLKQVANDPYSQFYNSIQNYITEIRHFATIGYRTKVKPLFLPRILSEDEIKEVETLGFYERVCSGTSQERNTASKVFLDMLAPILKDVAQRCYEAYVEALMMSDEDFDNAANAMQGCMPPSVEIAIEGGSANMSGVNTPQAPRSEYNMKLPDELEKKLQEKQKEEQNTQNSSNMGNPSPGDSSDSDLSGEGSNPSPDSSNSQSNSQSNNQDDSQDNGQDSGQNGGQKDGSSQDSSMNSGEEESNEGTNGSGGSENADSDTDANGSGGDENAKKGDKESDSKSSEADGESNESSGAADENGENESAESGEGNGSSDDENPANSSNYSERENAEEMLENNRDTEAQDADAAKRESLRNTAKSLEKNMSQDIQKDVLDNQTGEGKAPKLSNGLSYPGNISQAHNGVEVVYHPSDKIDGISYYGQGVNIKKCNKEATVFAKHLKELLMYQAKTRRLNGLKSGTLNESSLNRIVTDQKVFRKTIKGKVKKGRIEVLIDLSGSMSGSKMTNAIAAAYMLASACQKCKVPISVMGHCDLGRVHLFHYLEYENSMKLDAKDKILAAECDGCNRDGLAIFHALTDLVRHGKKDEQKILIVISDGAPNGNVGYYCGEYARDDIQHIESVFEKQFGVKMIGVGIGNDVAEIPGIYKNHVLVPNVSALGDELLKILKDILI